MNINKFGKQLVKKRPHLLEMLKEALFFSRFIVLLLLYLIREFFVSFGRIPLLGKLFTGMVKHTDGIYYRIIGVIDTYKQGDITSSDLISLALRHLKAKKARTFITIGGMAIGIGAIVFLLSIGYGVQKLIISRVARLDEMKQIDVSVGQASSQSLDKKAVEDFSKIDHVEYVLPSVSVVAKVSYNNSVSDIVAYGVTSDLLRQSAIKTSKGKIFESEAIDLAAVTDELGAVAGKAIELTQGAKIEKEINQVRYSIYPQVWKPVYANPDVDSQIIGYTKRVVSDVETVEVWGSVYPARDNQLDGIDEFDNHYSRWIKDSYLLWQEADCDSNFHQCEQGKYLPLNSGNNQAIQEGFITETDLKIDRYQIITDEHNHAQEGSIVKSIQFALKPGGYFQVYDQPKSGAALLNQFTKLNNNDQLISGQLVIGESYPDETENLGSIATNANNQALGYWVKARLPIWREVDCIDCDSYYLSDVESDDQGNETQATQVVYIKASQVIFESFEPPIIGQVLGDSTVSATLVENVASSSATPTPNIATASAAQLLEEDDAFAGFSVVGEGLDWVEIASSSAGTTTEEKDILPLSPDAIQQAIVNVAMLRLLGIEENKAIGEKINVSFVLDSSLFKTEDYQAETKEVAYEIIGIIPEEETPAFFVPFSDFAGTGIENYSQMKIVVNEKDQLKHVRDHVEEMGYKTSSVVDTVGKINSLFNTIRIILVLIGMIALGVAALGMFNTLTVSLLEKTREVGLMKAMGMKGHEVKRLFLAESIIISVIGGIAGVILGFAGGKLLSIGLSTVAISKGQGVLDVAYIPFFLVCLIIFISFVIGLITGIFPARRATKISALNALRYE